MSAMKSKYKQNCVLLDPSHEVCVELTIEFKNKILTFLEELFLWEKGSGKESLKYRFMHSSMFVYLIRIIHGMPEFIKIYSQVYIKIIKITNRGKYIMRLHPQILCVVPFWFRSLKSKKTLNVKSTF